MCPIADFNWTTPYIAMQTQKKMEKAFRFVMGYGAQSLKRK